MEQNQNTEVNNNHSPLLEPEDTKGTLWEKIETIIRKKKILTLACSFGAIFLAAIYFLIGNNIQTQVDQPKPTPSPAAISITQTITPSKKPKATITPTKSARKAGGATAPSTAPTSNSAGTSPSPTSVSSTPVPSSTPTLEERNRAYEETIKAYKATEVPVTGDVLSNGGFDDITVTFKRNTGNGYTYTETKANDAGSFTDYVAPGDLTLTATKPGCTSGTTNIHIVKGVPPAGVKITIVCPTPIPTYRVPNPPVFDISFPSEMQYVEHTTSQTLCVVDIYRSGDMSKVLKRRHTLNGSGWSDYTTHFTFCFGEMDNLPSPITRDMLKEGLNTVQFQYVNSFGEESPVITRNFLFHRL